jgi:crossover junction endodeoxyribonuclease RuvC
MIFVGIDPGLSGAVAVIYPHGQIDIFDTPTLTVVGEKTKRKYNGSGMASILEPFQTEEVLVILESVHSMPKQGVASSFSFGEGLGIWKGILSAYKLPLEMPSPQRWKKALLADQGKNKDASRFKAIQLFPTIADQLSRVKDDGRAEALLMAEYGRRLRNQIQTKGSDVTEAESNSATK